MRAHYLQHVPFEGLGSIAGWLAQKGATVTSTAFYDPACTLPKVEDIDLLIAMGGPMSVNDESFFPWLAAEKALIAEAIAAGKPVLGICLGAQLIASALGAPVYPNKAPEIGWYPVTATPGSATSFHFPPVTEVFHWHGETFALPRGAVQLARSEACDNQAFQLGERVLGLQFHLETTPESLAAMLENGDEELVPGPWVHSAEQLAATPAARYPALNALMAQVLDYLTRA